MASATKHPAPPPWGPALLRLRDGDKLDDFELDALPGLAWAGWAERRGGGYAITERGQDALNHLRRRRRWPSEEELNRALLDAPSLPGPAQRACRHETTAPPHEQPRNVSLIARLVEGYGFRVEEVPGDPGSRRVIPPRGEGYGVLDFDKTGQLACCAWELSTQRKDRHRIMDLAAGVSEAQLVTWLRWGRERARAISACTPRRHEELLRGAGLRLGCLLGQGYDTIHPAESGSPAVGRVVVNIGLIVELTWLEPWGSSHSRTYPDGATEADVSAWLEPWEERRSCIAHSRRYAAEVMGRRLEPLGLELVYHPERSARCADGYDHHEVRRNGAVVTRLCNSILRWWLLEGRKRRPITPAELVEHLSALAEAAPASAPEPETTPTQPTSFVEDLSQLVFSVRPSLIVGRDTTRQSKVPATVGCWRITTPGYQGGRILVRVEDWPDGYEVTCGAKGAKRHTSSRAEALEIIRGALLASEGGAA